MSMALEVLYVAHVFYYTVMYYLMSRSALYIPIAKARGFSAHFGKKFGDLSRKRRILARGGALTAPPLTRHLWLLITDAVGFSYQPVNRFLGSLIA
jgi:hypothetical protein